MFHYLSTAEFRARYFSLTLFFICFYINVVMVVSIQTLPDDIISELYLKYKDAVLNGQNTSSARRLFTNNKLYEIHIKKLKEVNGFKVHNLMIKEQENNSSLIYINNPVESKFPRAYLTLEEFKNALLSRVKAQKDELTVRQKQSKTINNITMKTLSTKTEEKSVNTLTTNGKNTNLPTLLQRKMTITEKISKKLSTVQLYTEITSKLTKNIDKKTNNIENAANKSTNNENSTITNKLSTYKETQDHVLTDNVLEKLKYKKKSSNITEEIKIGRESITEGIKTTSTQTVTVQIKLLTASNDSEAVFSNKASKESLTEVTKKIKKETPKRKLSRTAKVRENLTVKSTQRKRSTLGRPMVFMGGF